MTKKLKPFNLTIDRSRWLRGDGRNESYLYRNGDGKMCCLGFLGRRCGLRVGEIMGVGSPLWVNRHPGRFALLTDGSNRATTVCSALMTTNDERELPERKRESAIRKLFRQIGVRVRFVGK